MRGWAVAPAIAVIAARVRAQDCRVDGCENGGICLASRCSPGSGEELGAANDCMFERGSGQNDEGSGGSGEWQIPIGCTCPSGFYGARCEVQAAVEDHIAPISIQLVFEGDLTELSLLERNEFKTAVAAAIVRTSAGRLTADSVLRVGLSQGSIVATVLLRLSDRLALADLYFIHREIVLTVAAGQAPPLVLTSTGREFAIVRSRVLQVVDNSLAADDDYEEPQATLSPTAPSSAAAPIERDMSCAADNCATTIVGVPGAGQCWCDASCLVYGDCCDDFLATCPDHLPVGFEHLIPSSTQTENTSPATSSRVPTSTVRVQTNSATVEFTADTTTLDLTVDVGDGIGSGGDESSQPGPAPSELPTAAPSRAPTLPPTTLSPTDTLSPTELPTTVSPSSRPTSVPTTVSPTSHPTSVPTTVSPTLRPTFVPTLRSRFCQLLANHDFEEYARLQIYRPAGGEICHLGHASQCCEERCLSDASCAHFLYRNGTGNCELFEMATGLYSLDISAPGHGTVAGTCTHSTQSPTPTPTSTAPSPVECTVSAFSRSDRVWRSSRIGPCTTIAAVHTLDAQLMCEDEPSVGEHDVATGCFARYVCPECARFIETALPTGAPSVAPTRQPTTNTPTGLPTTLYPTQQPSQMPTVYRTGTVVPPGSRHCVLSTGFQFFGSGTQQLRQYADSTAEECERSCLSMENCRFMSFQQQSSICELFESVGSVASVSYPIVIGDCGYGTLTPTDAPTAAPTRTVSPSAVPTHIECSAAAFASADRTWNARAGVLCTDLTPNSFQQSYACAVDAPWEWLDVDTNCSAIEVCPQCHGNYPTSSTIISETASVSTLATEPTESTSVQELTTEAESISSGSGFITDEPDGRSSTTRDHGGITTTGSSGNVIESSTLSADTATLPAVPVDSTIGSTTEVRQDNPDASSSGDSVSEDSVSDGAMVGIIVVVVAFIVVAGLVFAAHRRSQPDTYVLKPQNSVRREQLNFKSHEFAASPPTSPVRVSIETGDLNKDTLGMAGSHVETDLDIESGGAFFPGSAAKGRGQFVRTPDPVIPDGDDSPGVNSIAQWASPRGGAVSPNAVYVTDLDNEMIATPIVYTSPDKKRRIKDGTVLPAGAVTAEMPLGSLPLGAVGGSAVADAMVKATGRTAASIPGSVASPEPDASAADRASGQRYLGETFTSNV